MTAFLNIQQLSVKLQQKPVLSSLDLILQEGEILGLVGASGCGKTTLLNTIAGFAESSNGCISIAGDEVVGSDFILPAQERQVGMIFQDYALFPHLTVRENIAFGLTNLTTAEQKDRIDNLLTLLKLTDHDNKYPHQISGGQQQRVAIARTLATQPKLLLLDEPFSNVDARLRNDLMLEIRKLLKQLNITAIFVTHNKDEVFTFADKMAVMAEGKVLQLDHPTVICQKPNCYQVADFLQLGSFIACEVKGQELITFAGKLNLGPNSNSNFSSVSIEKQDDDNGYCMLVKPKNLILLSDDALANVQVVHVGITEQGYHYLLSAIENNEPTELINLSFYSDRLLVLGQQVAVQIIPHEPLIFLHHQ